MNPQQSQSASTNTLRGKHVAMLLTDGVEQSEYTQPRQFLEQNGAEVTLVSPKQRGDKIQGFNHLTPGDTFNVELNLRDARPGDFDALVLPGGVANPDNLRIDANAISFIKEFAKQDKPIAAICHGPWTLIDAGLANGKRMTSWPSVRQDLCNAGCEWVDREVVVDGKLLTSRKPDDIPAFNQALMKALG